MIGTFKFLSVFKDDWKFAAPEKAPLWTIQILVNQNFALFGFTKNSKILPRGNCNPVPVWKRGVSKRNNLKRPFCHILPYPKFFGTNGSGYQKLKGFVSKLTMFLIIFTFFYNNLKLVAWKILHYLPFNIRLASIEYVLGCITFSLFMYT